VRSVFNFSAGPGVVPEEYSVIESSHRHERFAAVMRAFAQRNA
jgi:phosphoserine aminotransferase